MSRSSTHRLRRWIRILGVGGIANADEVLAHRRSERDEVLSAVWQFALPDCNCNRASVGILLHQGAIGAEIGCGFAGSNEPRQPDKTGEESQTRGDHKASHQLGVPEGFNALRLPQ